MARQTHVFGILLCVFILLGSPRARAAPTANTYAIKEQRLSSDTLVLTIYNVKTGHITWKEKLRHIDFGDMQISWSPDHRAVAIKEYLNTAKYRILIWKAGTGMDVYRHLRFPLSLYKRGLTVIQGDVLESSSIFQISLSPDKTRLLMRPSWNQGVGFSELWCLRLGSGRLQVFPQDTDSNARWLTSRKISFVPAFSKPVKPSPIVVTAE